MPFPHRALLLLCLASAANAQTYIVDQANGPGTHFTDIATATATVPDGAVLDVRPGNYATFTIVNKGLSVLCAPGVIVAGWPRMAITGTSAQQNVLLQGLRVQSGGVLLVNCQGIVDLQDCAAATWQDYLDLDASGCTRIHVDNCSFGAQLFGGQGVTLRNSDAVLRGCSMVGHGVGSGIFVDASTVQLIDCTITMIPYGVGVGLVSGEVRIVGGSVHTTLYSCIGGHGSARVDPSVSLQGWGWFEPTVQSVIMDMPAVATSGGALGSLVAAAMRGPNGDIGALLVGLPGAPLLFPGFADEFWLQPGTEAVCAFAVFATGIPLVVTYPVPNVPAMRGMRFCWQGATFGATNGLQASNPAITTHW